MSPFFDDLEAQLRAAAPTRSPAEVAAPPRRRWLRTGLRSVPALLAVATTVAVVAAAFVLLGHGSPTRAPSGGAPKPPPHTSSLIGGPGPRQRQELADIDRATRNVLASPGCQVRVPERAQTNQGTPSRALLSILGVLRRPASATDRLPAGSLPGEPESVYVRYVRRALVKDGVAYYIVPVHSVLREEQPPHRCFAEETRALHDELPQIPAALRQPTAKLLARMIALDTRRGAPQDAICLVSAARNGGGSACGSTVAQIAHGDGLDNGQGTLDGLVPDGVATVTLRFPATQALAALSVTTGVTGNVFAVHVARAEAGQLPAAVVWRSAQGEVLRTVAYDHGVPRAFCRQNPAVCLPAQSEASSSSASATTPR